MGTAKILRCNLQTQGTHGLPRMLERDAGLEPRDDLCVMPCEVPSHPGREGRRHPDIDLARRHEIEALRHYADYFVRLVVDRNLASDDTGRPAKAALPQPVADHNGTHAPVVLVLGEDASKPRPHTKHTP